MLSIGGVLLLHDVWMESLEATLAFVRHNLRFLEIAPMRPKAGTRAGGALQVQALVKRHPDNRQWDHFVTFGWRNYSTVALKRRWLPMYLRKPQLGNPACQSARDEKPWKYCRDHARTYSDCRKPHVRVRCNATCNGCT